MPKRRVVIVTALLLLLAAAGIMLRRDAEPTCAGRTLTQWLLQFERGSHRQNDPRLLEAEQAVRQIGTNALPTLLKWERQRPSTWKPKTITTVARIAGDRRARWLAGTPMFADSSVSNRELAIYGFLILGPQAKSAIPELVRLAHDPQIGARACFALSRIGSDAIPALLEMAAENPSRAQMVVPVISSMTEQVDLKPGLPALLQTLEDPAFAAKKLDLKPAIPALLEALKDPALAPIATRTLLKVAPEALTNTPPR